MNEAGWRKDPAFGWWKHAASDSRVWESCHECHVGKWYWRTSVDGVCVASGYAADKQAAMTAALEAPR